MTDLVEGYLAGDFVSHLRHSSLAQSPSQKLPPFPLLKTPSMYLVNLLTLCLLKCYPAASEQLPKLG
jgi:hypothetical protein